MRHQHSPSPKNQATTPTTEGASTRPTTSTPRSVQTAFWTPHDIHSLQRNLGNRAVMRLLGRTPKPLIHRRKAPQLQRFAVQIALDTADASKVGSIHIGGRPENLFGSSMGDHTTAWSVITAGLREGIRGKTITEAIEHVASLVDDARDLPGYADKDDVRVPEVHQERVNKADDDVTALYDVSDDVDNQTLDFLQRFAASYIHLRHAIPLSAAKFGRAKGKGESRPIQLLIRHEQALKAGGDTPSAVVLSDIRMAMWNLLDVDTIKQIAAAAPVTAKDNENLMGATRHPQARGRYAALLEQHLKSLKSSFPSVYAVCEINSKAALSKFMTRVGIAPINKLLKDLEDLLDGDTPTHYSALEEGTAHAVNDEEEQEIEDEEDTDFSPDPLSSMAVQLETNFVDMGDGKRYFVKRLHFGDRPPNTFRGGMGDHTTAWGVIVAGVEQAVHSKFIDAALVNMHRLVTEMRQLPGALIDPNTLPDRHKDVLVAARNDLNALDPLYNNPANTNNLNFLQNYIRAYLMERHATPLSAVKLGVASGKGESSRLRNLRDIEDDLEYNDGAETDESILAKARADMWDLLDIVSVEAAASTKIPDRPTAPIHPPEPSKTKKTKHAKWKSAKLKAEGVYNREMDEYVGAKEELMGAETITAPVNTFHSTKTMRAATMIKQHLLSLASAFPLTYDASLINSKASFDKFAEKKDLRDQFGVYMALFNALGMLTVADPTVFSEYEVAETRAAAVDEGEFVPEEDNEAYEEDEYSEEDLPKSKKRTNNKKQRVGNTKR